MASSKEDVFFYLYWEVSMTKVLVMPGHKNDIKEIISYSDAVLLGIQDFSVNFTEISMDELSEVVEFIKKEGKEIFISLNRNFHNSDLKQVEEILINCEKLKVDGIFYCDVAVYKIHHRLMLDLPLIWSAEHLATNKYTINYWKEHGIKGVFLSNEITKNEILEIKRESNLSCFTQVFGYLPMYVSKRHAISNYLKHFNLKTDSKEFSIWKEENEYPILERKNGTEIYSSFLLNALEEYLEYKSKKMEYTLISGFRIPLEEFKQVLSSFQLVNDENKDEMKSKIESLFERTSTGFLYKETVYQVKKNEK